MKGPVRLAFLGTPEICLPSLNFLATHKDLDLFCVITPPDRKAGRGQKLQSPPVALRARELGIQVFQSENINKDLDLQRELEKADLDLLIVFAFSQFLNPFWLKLPKHGAYNIHTSLLPKFRGSSPLHYALLEGEKKTGVSIQKMVKEMDAGDVAIQCSLDITPDETLSTLHDRLSSLSVKALEDFIESSLNEGIKLKPQEKSEVSFAPKITKDMGRVDLKEMSAIQVERYVRALTPWPGVRLFYNGLLLKILKAKAVDSSLKPYESSFEDQKLLVGTRDGSLCLEESSLPGSSKGLSGSDLVNRARGQKVDLIFSRSEQ